MLSRVEASRRSFLVGLGRYAAGAQAAALLPAAAFGQDSACPPPSAWTDLQKAVSGGVMMPDSAFFGDVARPNNMRFDRQPAGIARCLTAADVKACLAWVQQQNMTFAVRSGGHNYAGYSATNGLLIDMSLMGGVEPVKGSDGLVKVAGGSINSLVYNQLERLGRTLTHGRCDTVGAAGFLLGGGIGFDMRRFGMGSDLLRGTELVLANGEVVKADAKTNADLFWACRGGAGGNFGVNTSFTLQTFPVSNVTVFNLTWTKDLEKTLLLLLTELAEAPDGFGSKISVTIPSREQRCQGVGLTMSILGQLHLPAQKKLQSIIGTAWNLTASRVVKEDISYWVGQEFLEETTFPYWYQEKSSFMKAAEISQDAIAAMFEWAGKMPETAMPTSFKFFQVGGAIDKVGPTETAYVHRGFDWLFSVEANWWRPTDSVQRADEVLAWQAGFYADVNARTNAVGAFQNFADPSLKNWKDAYYGENYPRLTMVKAAVDPKMLFTYPQAIRPA